MEEVCHRMIYVNPGTDAKGFATYLEREKLVNYSFVFLCQNKIDVQVNKDSLPHLLLELEKKPEVKEVKTGE
jgi:hypothetical protein